MNKETLEHISSLMDGELSRETGLFLTRRLSADRELSGTWERYHLIRDCIRQPGTRIPVVDLSQRMKNALAAEAAGPVSPWVSKPWLKPLTGLAVAASVALMAIVAVDPGQLPQNSNVAATPEFQPFTSPNVLPTTPNSQAASFSAPPGSNPKLNSYLVRHNQLVGSVSNQGFLSFVPIVSNATPEESLTDDSGTDETGDEVNNPADTE